MRQKAKSLGHGSPLEPAQPKRHLQMARQWIIDCVVSFHHHKTMTMNVTQTRAPSGDQTNHQDAPVASIEPHDGDLVDWSRGAMKAVKAPSNAALARGSTFCETQCKRSTALRLRVASMLRGCLCPVNGRQWMMPRNESSSPNASSPNLWKVNVNFSMLPFKLKPIVCQLHLQGQNHSLF